MIAFSFHKLCLGIKYYKKLEYVIIKGNQTKSVVQRLANGFWNAQKTNSFFGSCA